MKIHCAYIISQFIPTETVSISIHDPAIKRSMKRNTAISRLFPHFNLGQNLAFIMHIYRISIRSRVRVLSELIGRRATRASLRDAHRNTEHQIAKRELNRE